MSFGIDGTWLAPVLCQGEPTVAGVRGLKNNPATFHHKLVEVNRFVSHNFEDFTLFDLACGAA